MQSNDNSLIFPKFSFSKEKKGIENAKEILIERLIINISHKTVYSGT